MYLTHELFNVRTVAKTGRQFWVRIVLGNLAAHSHETTVLGFLPFLVMHAATGDRTRHDATAIDPDSRHSGSLGILGLKRLIGVGPRLPLQVLPQLLSNLRADVQDLGHTDLNLRQLPQHLLCFARRLVFRVGRHDFVGHGGAIASLVTPQFRTLREKNLGHRPSNGKPVL